MTTESRRIHQWSITCHWQWCGRAIGVSIDASASGSAVAPKTGKQRMKFLQSVWPTNGGSCMHWLWGGGLSVVSFSLLCFCTFIVVVTDTVLHKCTAQVFLQEAIITASTSNNVMQEILSTTHSDPSRSSYELPSNSTSSHWHYMHWHHNT
jgi:hypothetical protein